MYRILVNKRIVLVGLFPFTLASDVVGKTSITTESPEKSIEVAVENETGFKRIARMFTIDEFNNLSPELTSVVHVSFMSMFIGALYGGIMRNKTSYTDLKSDQATIFKNNLPPKKKLQDNVTTGFGKSALRGGCRLSLFSTSYVGISTIISVYRGQYGLIEHIIAGSIIGIAYKFTSGPRGWIVGCGLGSVLGVVAGTLTYGILRSTGTTMDGVHYWQYKWKEDKTSPFKEAVKERLNKEQLLILHDKKHR